MVPRFRFAFSPTAAPHVGDVRLALFSWALARAMGGDFILRIEDGDAAPMLAALTWLTLDWDEGPDVGGEYGPYVQAQRLARHRQVVEQLVAQGHAYFEGDPVQPASAAGNCVRLRMPDVGETVGEDALSGPVVFAQEGVADPVLMDANGRSHPHLATITDDHDMGITHVVRSEAEIARAPIYAQLYHALGWPQPIWIHLPPLLSQDGQALTQRDLEKGYRISDFQDAGYLPQAVWNYLLLLGWTPDGEAEIVDKWTVRKQLRLERLAASPTIFDWDKLNWVNRQYLQRLSDEQVAEGIRPFLENTYDFLPGDPKWLIALAHAVRDGLNTNADAVEQAAWAFDDGYELSEGGAITLSTPPTKPILIRLIAELSAIVLLDEPTAQSILAGVHRSFQVAHDWSAGEIDLPIYAALTGQTGGPPLSTVMSLLGKQRALQRLADGLKYKP